MLSSCQNPQSYFSHSQSRKDLLQKCQITVNQGLYRKTLTNQQNEQMGMVNKKLIQDTIQERVIMQPSQNDIKINKKQSLHLPSLAKSALSNYQNISQNKYLLNPKKFDNKTTLNIIQRKSLVTINIGKKNIFKPLKSVHIKRNQQKSVQVRKNQQKSNNEQFYLPQFIRNFKLPEKKKIQIKPTMDIYKKRENQMQRFAAPLHELKKYKILSHIGKGSFSIVSLALNIQTNTKYAIKTYTKFDKIQQYKFDAILKQIQNMNQLKSHTNVIRIQSIVLDQRKILLIMENGGQQSLAGVLRKKKLMKQNQAKVYFKQIMQGMNYCHQNNICHRDLKLENILIDQHSCIKIIDFGFSAKSDKTLGSFCGTAPYMAPQIIIRSLYDGKKTDIWALGIILYVMLYGDFPFKSVHQNQLFRLIQQGKFQHNQTVSKEAKQTIDKMLKVNFNQRGTAQEILDMKWFKPLIEVVQ